MDQWPARAGQWRLLLIEVRRGGWNAIEQLAGLPSATIVVAENDLLRDEGEAYGRKLTEAGVAVTSTRYNSAIHDFVMLNALAGTQPARADIAQGASELRAAFAR